MTRVRALLGARVNDVTKTPLIRDFSPMPGRGHVRRVGIRLPYPSGWTRFRAATITRRDIERAARPGRRARSKRHEPGYFVSCSPTVDLANVRALLHGDGP